MINFKMDHRTIGTQQELFFFDDKSPGSCFWLPNGTHIYNKLQQFIRNEYYKRGFQEVRTPIIAKKELWQTSGHWDKYRENMFKLQDDRIDDEDNEEEDEEDDDVKYAICAMNCPKHCLIFSHQARSYKELPLRFADFGNLHRNELSHTLTGLTRVRQFCQDDAHIFCMKSQMNKEIMGAIEFIKHVYGIFGFTFEVKLSTRPLEYMGDIELWNEAEDVLKSVLNESGFEWELNEGDGAFYGPKIDIKLTDSLGRKHQTATIQLDFQLPINFNLCYVDHNNEKQVPVMIHRAIYGSFERFIAILCEHYQGVWPIFLSPKQVMIVPISEKFLDYAMEIKHKLSEFKLMVGVDDSDQKLAKKIRDAEVKKYNYIVVVGQKEQDNLTINVRENKEITTVELLVQDILPKLIG